MVSKAFQEKIIEYLAANPKAKNRDVMAALNVRQPAVSKARKAAVERGILKPSTWQKNARKRIIETQARKMIEAGHDDIEELIARVEASQPGQHLSTDESLRMLSDMARIAERDGQAKLAIDAIKAVQWIQKASATTQLGPKPPLTVQEKRERLIPILEACGPNITASVVRVVFVGPDALTFKEIINQEDYFNAGEVQGGESDARVQGGELTLGIEDGPEGDEQEAGHSHSFIGTAEIQEGEVTHA